MSHALCITGAQVIDPARGVEESRDLYARDGYWADSLTGSEKANAERIDARGLIAAPGLVDIHVHFREPGQTHKESIHTGSRAAAAGGFTTVVCMPNTSPVCDSPATIRYIRDIIDREALVRVYPTGTITDAMEGKRLAPSGSLKNAGAIAITDDGRCVQNNELMRRAVEYAQMHGLTVLDHCQDYSMTEGAVMHEGTWSMRLGLKGWPAAAEDLIVGRNVILAGYSGAHIHLQHISSRNAVELIRRAKQEGVPITAEATPHHLHLTDACLQDYGTHFKMNPPLRSEADRQAIIGGLLDGTLDCIATDHAPHTDYEKDCEFDRAPFGIIGLETAFAVCLEALVHSGHCGVETVIRRMTVDPARILNLDTGTLAPGKAADAILFDPDEAWTVNASHFHGRSRNSPWIGQTLRGRIKQTIIAGRTIFRDPHILTDSPAPAPADSL